MKVRLGIVGGGALLALSIASCCGGNGEGKTIVVQQPVPAPAPATVLASCDLTKRLWVQTSTGPCTSSKWRFMRLGDGTWQATETGCSGATGRALYDGSVVTVSFTYTGGSGVYSWPLDGTCRSVPGTVRWTSGPLAGKAVQSTLSVAP